MTDVTHADAPAGYRLGDPIELADLLALPPDDRRYDRDAEGRLTLMSPDDAPTHRRPMALLDRWLGRELDLSWEILPEPGIAFDPIWSLQGAVLPPSRLGRKTLGPDVAVYAGRPRFLYGRPDAEDPRYQVFAPDGLRLAVELLSRRTRRSDLGLGEAEEVDRWRTYLDNGVPELWLLNAGEAACGLPPRSALFLRNGGDRWEPLSGEDLRRLPVERGVHGLAPVAGGTVRSAALGLRFDLDAFWRLVDGGPAPTE